MKKTFQKIWHVFSNLILQDLILLVAPNICVMTFTHLQYIHRSIYRTFRHAVNVVLDNSVLVCTSCHVSKADGRTYKLLFCESCRSVIWVFVSDCSCVHSCGSDGIKLIPQRYVRQNWRFLFCAQYDPSFRNNYRETIL